MKHAVTSSCHSAASSTLDAYDFDDASVATQEIVDACKRRNCHSRARSKRQPRSSQQVVTGPFRFADVRSQDPAVFAHLLADHFVAREASNVAVASPAKPQQVARPVAGAVSLGSFRSWQFGERCLATYRVLFGRPLWAVTTPASPRPRKKKHVALPASSSSGSSEGGHDEVDQLNALESSGELLSLSTVDELLELPSGDTFELTDNSATPMDEEDVLAGLAIDFDDGLGPEGDSIELLWELDASDVDGGVMLTEGEEEELRFLTPDGDDMDDI